MEKFKLKIKLKLGDEKIKVGNYFGVKNENFAISWYKISRIDMIDAKLWGVCQTDMQERYIRFDFIKKYLNTKHIVFSEKIEDKI